MDESIPVDVKHYPLLEEKRKRREHVRCPNEEAVVYFPVHDCHADIIRGELIGTGEWHYRYVPFVGY